MKAITTNKIPTIGDSFMLNNILNVKEQFVVVTEPKKTQLNYEPYKATLRKVDSQIETDVYFYIEL